VPSKDPVNTCVPSGEKATDQTTSVWPVKVRMTSPDSISQSRAWPSHRAGQELRAVRRECGVRQLPKPKLADGFGYGVGVGAGCEKADQEHPAEQAYGLNSHRLYSLCGAPRETGTAPVSIRLHDNAFCLTCVSEEGIAQFWPCAKRGAKWFSGQSTRDILGLSLFRSAWPTQA